VNVAGLAGAKVSLLAGPSAAALTPAGSTTTGGGGQFSFHKRLRKKTYFRALVDLPTRTATCNGAIPGIPCAGTTANGFRALSPIILCSPTGKSCPVRDRHLSYRMEGFGLPVGRDRSRWRFHKMWE
jgi:hypothetical protein